MTGGSDAGCTVYVSADIALVGEEWCPRVQADAYLYLPRGEFLRHLRRRERTGSGRKREEEGIPLSVDLDPALCGAGLADDPPVFGERLRIGLGTELVQQTSRPLDVREKEGDGAGRKIGPHSGIMRQSEL